MGEQDARREWLKCERSLPYFIDTYCHIYDATAGDWIPFKLWKEQFQTLKALATTQLLIILKARQLGLTWLVLCFALWLMIFKPAKTVMLFSRRDDESQYLLERLQGVYKRLPVWCRVKRVIQNSAHVWELSNGSIVYAFPTTAGDSYTASLVIVDEADLIPDLDRLMNSVKPTIDGGGKMILLSRADKDTPGSSFKRMYRAAKAGQSPWRAVFLPWYVRPSRTSEWYEAQKQDSLARTGSLDDLYQQYPATEAEALAARSLDKRYPHEWLSKCFNECESITEGVPALPSLLIFELPEPGKKYAIGMDPAEGNPGSDDSSLTIVDELTQAEVASLRGKYEPTMFASYGVSLAQFYNGAKIMVERNNHGHAVIREIRNADPYAKIVDGWDGKPGWLTSPKGKVLLTNFAADAFSNGLCTIRTVEAMMQLESIEGSTLRAPTGFHDDAAVSFALALVAASFIHERSIWYSYS